MIEFNPAKLAISDFRGVPSFELEFVSESPTYVIGPNNAGKSTILNAIALVMKAGAFYKYSPQPFDFYHKSQGGHADRFSIQLDFQSSDQLPSVHTVGAVKEIHSIQTEGQWYKTSGRLDHSDRLLDEAGRSITLPTELKLSKNDTADYKEAGHGYKVRNANLRDIGSYLPEVWSLSASNLQPSLYSWKTGPLNRLSAVLSDRFFRQDWDFSFKDQTRKMPEGIEKAHQFFSAAVQAFPFWKDVLRPALESALSSYIGSETKVGLNPVLQSVEDWLQQQLLLSFASEAGGALVPLDRMGDGFQSLVRLAALEVLGGLEETSREKVLLLYEEPETYLHPHLRRKLRNVFDLLARKGWIIICATHAPEFVSFERKQSVHRLLREGATIAHGIVLTDALPDSLKVQEKLDEYGNHEIFFAQRIIFCEGKDDVFAMRSYLELSDIDLEVRSISILACDGIENIPDFVNIARALKIPFFSVTDLDKDASGRVKAKTAKVRNEIKARITATDSMAEWDNTLEDCLNTPMKQNSTDRRKALPAWQRDHVFSQKLADIKSNYPNFASACEKIISWLSSSD
jgi:predicted ATP-dependent endonuclease of OLD family